MLDERADRELLTELAAQWKQRKTHVREPRRMAEALSQLMAKRGYAQQRALASQEDAWNAVVGPEWARQSRTGLVRRGVLEVYVANSTLLQELAFRKQELLAQLIARLPDHKLRDLKFRIGPTG